MIYSRESVGSAHLLNAQFGAALPFMSLMFLLEPLRWLKHVLHTALASAQNVAGSDTQQRKLDVQTTL